MPTFGILILGGYGNFGARIARALAGHPAINLTVAGRDAARAGAFAAELGPDVKGVALDVRADDRALRMANLGAQLVIHTAGPFQQQRYDVALAAAQAGAHYIDLADARRFVCDFAAHTDAAFQAARRCAISGASTVPALSSAVVDHLTRGWQRIDLIDLCIAPAQAAARGLATMTAVLSYCGEPVDVWLEGRWQVQHGWAQPRRVHFARLRPRLGALCDIPDLELFPLHYPGVRSVRFDAALEVTLAQRALAALAALRRARCIPRPDRWARTLNALAPLFDRFGSALGGMVVRVEGVDATGVPARRSWHIAADRNHGPEIPCMAAIVLARRLAEGSDKPPIGAQACVSALTLHDFEPEFARWGMLTDVIDEAC